MHAQFPYIVSLVCLVFLATRPVLSQAVSAETTRAILTAQDLRDATVLLKHLADSSPAIKEKGALAAGSVQDTMHIASLIVLLSDSVMDVRRAAAFALGQMNPVIGSVQRSTITRELLKQLLKEENEKVRIRLLEGLGKTGSQESLDEVAAVTRRTNGAEVRGEIALAIGRYAYRNFKSVAATTAVAELLDVPGEEWKAAYALMRIGDGALMRERVAKIVSLAHHVDAQVRMYVATVLGKLPDVPPSLDVLTSLAETDPDWRVRVNAVKALAGVDLNLDPRVGTALVKAISDPNEHVSLAVLTSLAGPKVTGSGIAEQLRLILTSLLDGPYTVRQKKEAAIALAKIFGNDATSEIAAAASKGNLLRTSYIEALGYILGSDAHAELLSYSRQVDPKVQRVALDAILTSCALAPPSREMVIAARSSFVRALGSEDMAVITTAAGALADSLLADSTVISPLLESLNRMKSPGDVEAMTAVIQALGSLKAEAATSTLISTMNDSDRAVALEAALALEKITGNEYRQFVAPHSVQSHTNFDWALLEWLREHPHIMVHTSRGAFTIRMFPDEAPFTCVNIATLIKKGFYGGLLFHRVVPNFVIQGGDPRGDGWGGPGYAMRSEFGYSHYERGMVGVASSGKDTEGSQFFVTHSRQPHLDGRYTIFGRVTAGMDVVDMIQMGDTIRQITFSRDALPSEGK